MGTIIGVVICALLGYVLLSKHRAIMQADKGIGYGAYALGVFFVSIALAITIKSFVAGEYMSEGEITGTVFDIEHEGAYWRTWEGQIATSGFRGQQGANVHRFSIDALDPHEAGLVSQIRSAGGAPIRLRYREVTLGFPWRGNSDYLVYAVERL